MIKLLISLVAILCSAQVLAQGKGSSKLKPLYFQADKNNLQVLPQRFEYTLIDDDRLKVGDILIDTTQVTFQIEPSGDKEGTFRIHFTWPAGLIKDGELAIKNNSGKAIFNAIATKKELKITQGQKKAEEEHLRSEIATFTVEGVEANLVNDMKYFPFMVFCIYKESEETRLYLCSKELYLSSQQGQMVVKSRSATKRSAQIEINGKVVGNQGIIYLNDRSETVAFKAQTQTGAFLEVETRKKDVDFKDLVVSEDNTKIILTATGAEPVDETKVKKLSETDWQIALPKDRPVLYLKGEGDIPMRQEFYVRGNLPREKSRPFLSPRSASRTYSSSLTFNGITPEGVQVRPVEKDTAAKVEPTKKNQFQWTIRDIPAGAESRRYLMVTSDNNEFQVGYDVFRGHPMSISLGLHYQTPAAVAFAEIEYQWWFENFLMINADWSRFRFGISLERDQQVIEKSGEGKIDFTTVHLNWRAKPGFNLSESTWGLSFPLQMLQAEGVSSTAYGVGAFLLKKPHRWLKPLMHWTEVKFDYLLGSTGDFKVTSAYILRAQGYWQASNQLYWRYGLDLSSYKFDPSSGTEEMQIGLNGGALWKF
ncbi:hypothetical protein [Bdellovibrio reynosensis]|uniref:Uncharacterized protein n=1 Tax=Bdellovibrio reynosensis TaxID=2835041 RepID=A0ABY4C9R4_9BACT|nr:hypothetical protein [Bdellovibrio reynosensis]UOF01702.1 hypothetical protein MNR06_01880 [Bdellovibrio reynosensis]